jgi:hypothetical protein
MKAAAHPDSDYYAFSEKLRLFLPCLRQRMFPKRNLFAGPYAGEFGWELMQWQGFVRARRPYYKQVHVLTYPGRDYLYEGCTVHHHDIDLKTAGYRYGTLNRTIARKMAKEKATEIGLEEYDIFSPPLLCTRHHKAIWKQDFRLFQEAPLTTTLRDVVFHFRSIKKEGPDVYQDYSATAADELVQHCLERGLLVGCIGHPSYSYCPPGCEDYRSIDLRQTVAAMSSAHAVVGKNSGPMHLASLCGKPTIQWAEDQWRLDFSLRWNPFRVPIYIVSNTESQPSPRSVYEAIANALADLRQKSNDFTQPVYTVPAQQIAGY